MSQNTLENIVNSFPITNSEYEMLDKRFGKLCHYASWELKRKNSKNNNTNDPDDDVQELRIALIRAGSYYKRQTYIEKCFASLGNIIVHGEGDDEIQIYVPYIKDGFLRKVLIELHQLQIGRAHV